MFGGAGGARRKHVVVETRTKDKQWSTMVEICGRSGDLIWDATEILKFHCPFFSQ